MRAIGSPAIIDGAYGEGGSALLRTVLQMSAVTQQPVRIQNVRGAAKLNGLTPEDILIARLLGQACQAEIEGLELNSTTLSFVPKRRVRALQDPAVKGEEDGFTNIAVVFNTLLPVLAGAGAYSTLNLRGETHGLGALSFDYFSSVTLPAHRMLGLYAYPNLLQAGFGRQSGGSASIDIEPSHLEGFDGEDRGSLRRVRAVVTTAELPDTVGQRGVAHLRQLAKSSGVEIEAESVQVKSRQPGAYITVWAEFERGFGGGTAMGQRGLRIEAVAQQAFQGYFDYHRSGCTFDPYLADQVLAACALAEGETSFKVSRLTDRFTTMVWAIKQFVPIPITVKGQVGQPGTVRIRR